MKNLEPINLQLFAEPPADPPADSPPASDPPPAEPDKDLQAEAQKIADAIVAKKLKGMPSKEDLKAFREWQEQQKTPEQKEESEELAKAKREAEKYKAQAQAYERERAAVKAGVSPEYAEFVAFAAGRQVDDDTDFDTALAAYLKENPQYKGSAAPTKTGMSQGKSGTEASLADEIRGQMYPK